MTVAEIMNLVNNMTTPDSIIEGLDVTGVWGDALVYTSFLVVVFATADRYPKISFRLAMATFSSTVLGVLLFTIGLCSVTALLRSMVGLVVSIIYLYQDKGLVLQN